MEEPKTKPEEDFYYSADPTPLNEILGAAPGWLLRSGIGIVAFFVFVLLGGSMLFRYPDIIEAPVVVQADNPPVNLVAVNNGKIDRIFRQEGEHIEKGALIAVIESPLQLDNILWLRQTLLAEPFHLHGELSFSISNLPQNINLGQLQNVYNDWLKALHDKEQFEALNYHAQRKNHLQTQLTERHHLEQQIQRQLETFRQIYQLSRQNYQRDSALVVQQFISPLDYERTHSEYLSRHITLEDYQSQLINLEVQKNDIRSTLLETQMDYTQKQSEYRMRVQSSLENLKSQLLQWEKSYAFVAPVSGELVFASIWSSNQQVTAGDLVFSIIPDNYGQFIARGRIPLHGSGKVKPGNRVNIRLSNYPYQEFGVLQGEVMHIAAIPSGDHYPVQLRFNNQLVTSYDINLGHHAMLDGVAQIITEDISLFNRMMNPLRSLRRNR
ncbi:MAG: HlyD family secretion protein [Bacteroidales bacterium]|nr:HlyD family secretion protein [Bacteroidales bacterium]